MKARRAKAFKWLILLTIVSGLLFLHFYVPRIITEIRNPIVGFVRDLKGSNKVLDPLAVGRKIEFESFDGVAISGYFMPADGAYSKGTIILLHGIRSSKECYADLSSRLSDLGYNSVAIDLRGHGKSGGRHCTFGVKEKQDVSALIDFLANEEGIAGWIGIWGRSLGGAIALQAMGFDDRIGLGIVESAFSDFRTIVGDYSGYHLGFSYAPLTDYLVGRAGAIAGFNPADARPVDYCQRIKQPILLVHGNADKRISISYARENFRAIASTDKEFVEVSEAGHLDVWKIGGIAYFNQVVEFISTRSGLQ